MSPEQSAETLLHDMDETRASLKANLKDLETQLQNAVSEGQSALREAKTQVEDAAGTLVKDYPVISLAATAGAGFVLGKWLVDRERPFFLSDELKGVRNLALRALVREVGKRAKEALPSLAAELEPILESAEQKIKARSEVTEPPNVL